MKALEDAEKLLKQPDLDICIEDATTSPPGHILVSSLQIYTDPRGEVYFVLAQDKSASVSSMSSTGRIAGFVEDV